MRKASSSVMTAALVIMLASRAQAPVASQLVKIGSISAENGEFAFLSDVISAFSDGDIGVTQGTEDKWSTFQYAGKAVTYKVTDSSMKRVTDGAPIAAASEFQFCDSFDQVSRPVDDAFRAALPDGAKVKSVEDYGGGRTLVIYSAPGAGHYQIDFSLLESTASNRYSDVATALVSRYGDYCGMQAITREVRAVLVDEPAGSSDYSAVYLFAIQGKKLPRK